MAVRGANSIPTDLRHYRDQTDTELSGAAGGPWFGMAPPFNGARKHNQFSLCHLYLADCHSTPWTRIEIIEASRIFRIHLGFPRRISSGLRSSGGGIFLCGNPFQVENHAFQNCMFIIKIAWLFKRYECEIFPTKFFHITLLWKSLRDKCQGSSLLKPINLNKSAWFGNENWIVISDWNRNVILKYLGKVSPSKFIELQPFA